MNIGSPFTMVVLIVAIVFGARLWRTQMIMQSRMGRSRADEQLIGSMQSQIDRLTDRVSVLEKLVTDDDRRLAGEIERLRNGRPGASI
jgi:hypothetical protein